MFESFLENKESWMWGNGPDAQIVISSRVRLARNLKGFHFPSKASLDQKNKIFETVKNAALSIASLENAFIVKMDELEEVDKQFLIERHLISQEHSIMSQGKGILVIPSEIVSVMVNEEDHLRLQVIMSGFDLPRAWEKVNEVDSLLAQSLEFSFLPELGYLTACPTNVGTALRASCMLHLPALVMIKRINKILELLAKLSYTARGFFGEGTQALGNFFQISNQVSLGVSEEEIIDNLSGVVRQIREQELNARTTLLKRQRYFIEDRVWRSYAILRNSRLISTKEALSHLSMLCIGLDLGIISGIEREKVNSFFIAIQPAHLQKMEGKLLQEKERDYIRASILRERLA